MSSQTVYLTSLIIPNGQTVSNTLQLSDFRDADSITIFAPQTLPETVTVQIAGNLSPLSTDWVQLFRLGVVITVPVNDAIVIELPSFSMMRLVAGVAVAAQRTFTVNKSFSA